MHQQNISINRTVLTKGMEDVAYHLNYASIIKVAKF